MRHAFLAVLASLTIGSVLGHQLVQRTLTFEDRVKAGFVMSTSDR